MSNTLSAYFTSPAIFGLTNVSTILIVCIHSRSHGVVYRHCSNVYIHCIAFPHTAYHTINTTYLLWPYCIINVSTLLLQLRVYTYVHHNVHTLSIAVLCIHCMAQYIAVYDIVATCIHTYQSVFSTLNILYNIILYH